MKFISTFLRIGVFAGLYVSASLQAVLAEDTEIFFAPPSAAVAEKPNILFIIDTSGSMGWGVAGTTDSRMEVVQDVMDEVLTNITNVNAGLMRFNNGRPGPVLFPVLDIDQEATPTAFQTISDGANDVVEAYTAGIVNSTSAVLEFNGVNRKVGIRFEDLNIPQGATIISANVLFTANGDSSGAADVTISGELIDSAPPIVVAPYALTNRHLPPGATTATEVWTMSDWTDGNIYASEDIADIVEEIVARPGWCGGNDMLLFFDGFMGSASRVAYSKDGVDALPAIDPDDPANVFAPRIKIEYSQTFDASATRCMTNEAVSQVDSQGDDFEIRQNGSVYTNSSDLEFYLDGSDAQQGVGMVFKNIKVPQGATISYAYLSFTANEDSVGTTDVNIEVVEADTVLSPSNDGDRILLAGMPSTGVPWNIADNWITGNVYQSVSIVGPISQITSRAGWALDNNMALFIRGINGRHVADSFSGDAPKLHIGFRGVWEPGVNTIRDDLKAAVAGLVPSNGTPISGTYAEAGAYFRGDPVFYGASRNNNRFSRVSHPLSYSSTGTVLRAAGCEDSNLDATECASETITGSPNYESPIVESCQGSHIVFLTDGSSNSHLSSTNTVYSNWSNGGTCSSSSGGNDCSIKMAAWLNTNDVAPAIAGKQVVTTHMIGFGPGADPDLMQDMATAGGGGYYSPSDRATLISDISKIISGIASVNSTFVTAGVTVNQYNRVTNNEERYFSLFTPVNKESWPGNIKRYKLSGSDLVDANDVIAIDPVSAEFKSTSQSFWSSSSDGNDVERGGAAEQLTLGRKVYSNIASSNLSSDPANAVKQSNTAITTAILGGVTTQRRDAILYWATGYDVNDAAYDPADSSSLTSTPTRKDIGDPLHSQPAVIQYNDSVGNIETTRIYVGTNHGFLHSIDASNGVEDWAFVPKDLLPRLDDVVTNSTTAVHTYGLDGSVSLHLEDANGNGAVDPGDQVYLYIGMRRGGKSYYALNVTDPDNPEFMFQITDSGDYSDLGETWSKPIIGQMNLSGVNSDKLVMIFGGGYDNGQDVAGTPSQDDSVGDNVYIADAYTGALLWDARGDALPHGGAAGPVSSMNSVPSTVSAFDLSDDGYIDHIYVTDTKAQVFRFDVDNTAQTIKGGRIASLQSAADAANNRRFYYAADTSLIRQVGDSFIAVSIGSGYRAHPLDLDVDDSFYVLRDKGGLTGSFDMDATLSDLQNINSLADSDSNGVSDSVELLNDTTSAKKGWYLDLTTSGEKVLAKSVTFNNAVLFTTYIPPSGVASACEAAAGGGRLYALNILNGNPYLDTNTDGSLDENDRFVSLLAPGIAPQVDITITSTGEPIACVGRQCFDDVVPRTSAGILGYKWRKTN